MSESCQKLSSLTVLGHIHSTVTICLNLLLLNNKIHLEWQKSKYYMYFLCRSQVLITSTKIMDKHCEFCSGRLFRMQFISFFNKSVRKFYSSVQTDCQSVWQFYFSVRIHFNKLFIHLNDFANPLETLISLILSNCLRFVVRSLSVHFSHSNLSRSQICMIHIHIHIHDFMSMRYKLEITPWVWNLTPLISSF